MSTDSEVNATGPAAPRTGQQPGALALLTATVIGGIAASRLPKAPFVLAAGATALALWKQKKSPAAAPAPEAFNPAPPEHVPAQNQVAQWLQQQMSRESEAPVIALPAEDAPASAEDSPFAPEFPFTTPAPEDDYTPQSLLIDDTEAHEAPPVIHESFAALTEPVPPAVTPPAPAPAEFAAVEAATVESTAAEPEAEHLTPFQALEASESSPAGGYNAAWLLGIEPVPSLVDPPALATAEERIGFFTGAPAAPEVFTVPLFQAGPLPDQIELTAPEPKQDPLGHLLPVFHTPAAGFPPLQRAGVPALPSETAPEAAGIPPPAFPFTLPLTPPPDLLFHTPAAAAAPTPAGMPSIPAAAPEAAGFPPPPSAAAAAPEAAGFTPHQRAGVPALPSATAPEAAGIAPPAFPFTLPLTPSTELQSVFPSAFPAPAPAPAAAPAAAAPAPAAEVAPAFAPASLFSTLGSSPVAAPGEPFFNPAAAPASQWGEPAPPPFANLAALFSSPAPVPAPIPEAVETAPPQVGQVEVQEISVQLAGPGEASFDPPTLEAALHPWHSPLGDSISGEPAAEGVGTMPSAAPTAPTGPIIDAEIILRPRLPGQNNVTAKTKPIAPIIAKAIEDPPPPAADSVPPPPALPDKRPRSSWRSWWRSE